MGASCPCPVCKRANRNGETPHVSETRCCAVIVGCFGGGGCGLVLVSALVLSVLVWWVVVVVVMVGVGGCGCCRGCFHGLDRG